MSLRSTTLCNRTRIFSFTIPASPALLSTGVKAGMVAAGLSSALADQILSLVVGFRISGKVAAGTDRAAITVASEGASGPFLTVAAGADYEPPTLNDMKFMYVDAASEITTCIIELYQK